MLHQERTTPTQAILNALHLERQARMQPRKVKAAPTIPVAPARPPTPVTSLRAAFTLPVPPRAHLVSADVLTVVASPAASELRLTCSVTRRVTIRNIQDEVCAKFDMTPTLLIAQRRSMDVVLPRQIAMYLAKELTTSSLPQIGRVFGGRDHTTVLHAIRKIAALIETDAKLAADVAAIKRALRREG